MMLLIVVEVAGTVCDADCSIFSQTVDRQRLQQLFEVWHVRWAEAASLAAAEKCFDALVVCAGDKSTPR